MKASMYLNYTSRSLVRGGQRTLLALFCIAVGVMAIVALQLVGQMITNSFTSNVRDANGGDVAVTSSTTPFQQSDLAFFDDLKRQGIITAYTPIINVNGSTSFASSITQSFTVRVVDPASYPVATAPTVITPPNGSLSSLLTENNVLIDQTLADQYNKKIGDSFDVHASTFGQGAVVLHTHVAGMVKDNGVLAQTQGVMLVPLTAYKAAANAAHLLVTYDSINIATDSANHTKQANDAIHTKFPLVERQTTDDALKSSQQQNDLIKKFLKIAGLLALLIGGVGIVNTMQVLLSRRKIEIAMLKTVGYRRFDLYLLFGLEAALLGIIGGILGAAIATGLSYLVLQIIEQAFQFSVPFALDPIIIGGGVLIGLCTALIFGLMPIVQAANIRPLNVIRELPGSNRASSIGLTILLLIVLSVLFCLLSIFILNDIWLGIGAVYGTFVFLGLLSLFFVLVVLVIGKLPVPERFNIPYLALIVIGVALSALLTLALPAFGILLLVISLMGIVVVLLPRTWKASMKMALRNIGRQRARTTTTLLALFVGVFTIGLILVLGQNLRDQINNVLAKSLNYNVFVTTHGNDTTTLRNNLSTLPGLTHSQELSYATVRPLGIDGEPLQNLLSTQSSSGLSDLPANAVVALLNNVRGYNVASGQLPDSQTKISDGRNLTAEDASTDNVLVPWSLVHLKPLQGHLKVGSTITVANLDGKSTKTLTVIGVYQSNTSSGLLAPIGTMRALAPGGQEITSFSLKIASDQVGKALNRIGQLTPNASVLNLANIGDFINDALSKILLVLTLLASLSLLAGVIIIANAVALAMLERRRELGILKSVGYTGRSLLGEVLIENGIVGGTGALLAMLLVTLATSLLGKYAFNSSFGVTWYIAIGLILGVALLAIVTSTLVAWGSVRIRPLEVLRYE